MNDFGDGSEGDHACSRCGADLSPLLRLRVRVQALQSSVLLAIANKEWAQAGKLSQQLLLLHNTAENRQMARALSDW